MNKKNDSDAQKIIEEDKKLNHDFHAIDATKRPDHGTGGINAHRSGLTETRND